jgi:SH3-like domain-containing protein
VTITFGLRGAMGGSERHLGERDFGVAIPTKTGLRGQASENWWPRLAVFSVLGAAAVALAACGDHGAEGKDCPAAARASTISGFCVPRWVSLKRDTVFARKGPGVDYPTLWVYRARGLPVQVVGETLDWRRICDPDGGAVWVHRSMIDGRRMVRVLGPAPTPLLGKPLAGAKVEGLVKPRSLAALDKCHGDWCRLSIDGVGGWMTAGQVWGVAAAAQCR